MRSGAQESRDGKQHINCNSAFVTPNGALVAWILLRRCGPGQFVKMVKRGANPKSPTSTARPTKAPGCSQDRELQLASRAIIFAIELASVLPGPFWFIFAAYLGNQICKPPNQGKAATVSRCVPCLAKIFTAAGFRGGAKQGLTLALVAASADAQVAGANGGAANRARVAPPFVYPSFLPAARSDFLSLATAIKGAGAAGFPNSTVLDAFFLTSLSLVSSYRSGADS